MRGLARHDATLAALTAILLASEACSSDPVIIGGDSAEPTTLGVGLVGQDTSGVLPQKRVKDLLESEAVAWCEWFSRVFPFAGTPTPGDLPVEAGGVVSGYGVIGCVALGVCTEHLSLNHCVANLGLQPCEATVAELDSCVGVLWGLCQLPERCEAFFAASGCLGTIVTKLEAADVETICQIRVE